MISNNEKFKKISKEFKGDTIGLADTSLESDDEGNLFKPEKLP